MKRVIFGLVVGLAATTALAHSGVKNAAVRERMMLMSEIGAATKVIGQMIKGQVAFDAGAAQDARQVLMTKADGIAAAFRANESDPKSEALPAIWQDYTAFEQEAKALRKAAKRLDVSSRDTLRAGFAAVGKSCGSCHSDYRK